MTNVKALLTLLLALGAITASACSAQRGATTPAAATTGGAPPNQASAAVAKREAPQAPAPASHQHTHAPVAGAKARVPAHHKDAASAGLLPPVLPPDQFFGMTRAAYKAVREIPHTIAQLPCYCYCDEGHGHKSLHSCFVDDHAAHCAVCVDEALLAYKLQKEDKLSPAQIRERIIAEYAPKQ